MGMKGGREADLVRAVLAYLAVRRIPCFRLNAGGVRVGRRWVKLGPAGAPDIIAVLPPRGTFCGIECKAQGGRLRPTQRAVRDSLVAAGGVYVVARSLGDVEAALGGLG